MSFKEFCKFILHWLCRCAH